MGTAYRFEDSLLSILHILKGIIPSRNVPSQNTSSITHSSGMVLTIDIIYEISSTAMLVGDVVYLIHSAALGAPYSDLLMNIRHGAWLYNPCSTSPYFRQICLIEARL